MVELYEFGDTDISVKKVKHMKTFSSNLSFKELCGYGMPISTMFTNGILKADDSGSTKIQAPDNAMYNGTSFKTLVAFGLVTEGGIGNPNAISVVDADGVVVIATRNKGGDASGDLYPYFWGTMIGEEELWTNTESPIVDPDGSSGQMEEGLPILGWLKGNGSVYEITSSTDVPSAKMKDNDRVDWYDREYWKVDFNSNPLLVQFVRSYDLDPNMVVAMWVYQYKLLNGDLDALVSIVLYEEGGTRTIKFVDL